MESRVAAKNGENFRAEKRNKHARILTMRQVRQVPSLKNLPEFRGLCKQRRKVTSFNQGSPFSNKADIHRGLGE